MNIPLNTTCPLCGKSNNCCNGTDKSRGICWCTNETFPQEIFDLLSEEDIRKKCICQECLHQFKN